MTAEIEDGFYPPVFEYDDYDDRYEPDTYGRACLMCGVDLDVDWDDLTTVCDDCDSEVSDLDRHALNRDAKRAKVTGMQVSGRSIKTVIVPIIAKRGREAHKKGGRRYAS